MNKLEEMFQIFKERIPETGKQVQKDVLRIVTLFAECVQAGGVIQLFGVRHGEEFVNELNFRAGGLAPFHGMRVMDLALNGYIEKEEVESGKIFMRTDILPDLLNLYKLDDRDLYCIVSAKGNEPLTLALAQYAKANGHTLVAVVNGKTTIKEKGQTIADLADCTLDMMASQPDVALWINNLPIGQLGSTLANISAQMITAEMYAWYIQKGLKAPVLLSANIEGADKHNAALTDQYNGRVR